MNVKEINDLLLQGKTEIANLFTHIDALAKQPIQFEADFGLTELPKDPGIIMVRGARQLGKSTWLESMLKKTVATYGAGSAIYLNGDVLLDADMLASQITSYLPLLVAHPEVAPRIFIDEITAVPKWEHALKYLYDSGATRHVLFITTGSKAIDLRRGTERLPGRKGRLQRTNYIFTPISFKQFHEKCAHKFTEDLVILYMITGGSPLAINEYLREGELPHYVIELVKDWILGECSAQNRSRNLLTWVSQQLFLRGGTPIPLHTLAAESGAANNTVVRGYVDLLQDLLCLSPSVAIDANTKNPIPRKPHKYHFTNTLVAVAFSPSGIRSVKHFEALPETEQGAWYEWLVAQELWRRRAISDADPFDVQYHLYTSAHEIDFKTGPHTWLEVKRGKFSPVEFAWFSKIFPKDTLQVVCSERWQGNFVEALTFEDFLLDRR